MRRKDDVKQWHRKNYFYHRAKPLYLVCLRGGILLRLQCPREEFVASDLTAFRCLLRGGGGLQLRLLAESLQLRRRGGVRAGRTTPARRFVQRVGLVTSGVGLDTSGRTTSRTSCQTPATTNAGGSYGAVASAIRSPALIDDVGPRGLLIYVQLLHRVGLRGEQRAALGRGQLGLHFLVELAGERLVVELLQVAGERLVVRMVSPPGGHDGNGVWRCGGKVESDVGSTLLTASAEDGDGGTV